MNHDSEDETGVDIGRLFTGAEPPHRDFAECAIASGEKAFRRQRSMVISGTALSVVAVVGVAMAAVTGTSPQKSATTASPATRVETSASAAALKGTGADKVREMEAELPGVLNAMLPAGVKASFVGGYPEAFVLTRSSGETRIDFDADPYYDAGVAVGMCDNFTPNGKVTSTDVDGGKLYVQTAERTFKDALQSSSGDTNFGEYVPGSIDRVETKTVCYTYVSDKLKTPLQVVETTDVAKPQYAAKAPDSWNGLPWPPTDQDPMPYDPDGAALTQKQIVALITSFDFGKAYQLIDTSLPASQEFAAKGRDLQKKVADMTKSVMPDGYSLQLDSLEPGFWDLVDAQGSDIFDWSTEHVPNPVSCAGAPAGCTMTKMAGGLMYYQPGDTNGGGSQYIFRPDGGDFQLNISVSKMGTKHASAKDLTLDQVAALAKTPGIEKLINDVNSLNKP